MSKLKQVREQLISLYREDDDSLINQNIRNIVDSIDNYLAEQDSMSVPTTALQTIGEYDVMIQIAMEDFNALEDKHTPTYVHNRSYKAQEIIAYIATQSHYISYIKERYLKNIPPEHKKTYMSMFYNKLEENKELMGQYRTIVSNLSKEMDYININLQEKLKCHAREEK